MNLKLARQLRAAAGLLSWLLLGMSTGPVNAQPGDSASSQEGRVPVTFTGGYATNPMDHGRPVVLVAGALQVPPEVFRDAFSRVKPAPAGETPDPGQVRLNKQALLDTLAPYGVTNERLDEVSNFYRYNRSRGEWWRHHAAAAYAIVQHGVVTDLVITDPGFGYSSPPKISLAGGREISATAALEFGPDFAKNGSIKEIKLGK